MLPYLDNINNAAMNTAVHYLFELVFLFLFLNTFSGVELLGHMGFWGLFFFFCIFKAAPVAYGGSQARGPIGAVATGLHHSSQQ